MGTETRQHVSSGPAREREAHTTLSESLGLDVVTEKARICGRSALLAERAAVLNTEEAILLAMVGGVVFNDKRILRGTRRRKVNVVKPIWSFRAACWMKMLT